MVPDYALWIALFTIFISEHVKLRGERVAIVGLRGGGRASVFITREPIKFGRRYAYLLPPITIGETFHLGEFFSNKTWTAGSGSWEMKRIRLTHRAVCPFLIVEPALFIFYFAFCPLLTLQVGLGVALRLIIPVHIGLLLLCTAMIVWLPGLPLRGTRRRLTLAAELLVSPGLMPAISKRLTSKRRVATDVPASAATSLNLQNAPQMHRVLSYRLEELVQFGEATPEAAAHYLSGLEGTT